MGNKGKMDLRFYLIVSVGVLTLLLAILNYSEAKKKEIEADEANKKVVELQSKLQEASDKIINLSNENAKQIIGHGAPTLQAHFDPDKLISLAIENNNDYPIYDVQLNFPNPDSTIAVRKMVATGKNLSWEDVRKQWVYVGPYNLPPRTRQIFYEFTLPQSLDRTSCFLNITARNGTFSGSIYIKRNNESFSFYSVVMDSNKKIINELHPEFLKG